MIDNRDMLLLAVTRLRVRSVLFLPGFLYHSLLSLFQARNAEGCLGASIRWEQGLVFWTRTAWTDARVMRAFMTRSAHGAAMRKLQHWCNEASLVHWEEPREERGTHPLPDWQEAKDRLKSHGRVSHVTAPSAAHIRGETAPC